MKKFLFALLCVAFAVPAFAAGSGGTAFQLYSAASGATKTSSWIDVRAFRTKTLTVSGATLNSNASSATFKNMSGTVTIDCSADKNVTTTCTANDYAQTAVSKTTNGQITWSDATPYIRLKWVAGTVGTKMKAFLNWIEN